MKFEFKQLFDLIEKTFEIKRSSLANYLFIDKSTISRLYSGKTHSFHLSSEKIYTYIFDSTTQKSLAYEKYPNMQSEDIEHLLLDIIKQIMEDEHWTDSTKGITNDKYKDYILGLIKLACANSMLPKKEIAERDETEKKENVPDDSISSFLSEDRSSNDLPVMEGGAAISTPISYRKCLYCEYFDIAKTIHKYDSGALGTCTVSEKKVNFASPACNNFLENTRKITHDMLMGFSNKFGL